MDERPTVFSTERLIAREWALADVEDVFDLYRREEVVRHLGRPAARSLAEARGYLEFLIERNAGWPEGYGSYPLFHATDGRFVGAGLCKHLPGRDEQPTADTEIGWHLHPEAWGQGFATEVGRQLVARGFAEIGLAAIHAVVEPGNEKSCAVARRLGMEHRGRTTEYYGGRELEHFVLSA